MGKVGPNVLFESVVLDKPFLGTTHMPGQEEGNFAFLERYGPGQVAVKVEEQPIFILSFAHSQETRQA